MTSRKTPETLRTKGQPREILARMRPAFREHVKPHTHQREGDRACAPAGGCSPRRWRDGETTPKPTAAEPAERAARGTTARQSAQKRSNRIVSVIAYDAKNSTVQEDLIDFTALDFDQVPGWIGDIDEGAANLTKLSKRLGEEWKKNAAARAAVEN